MSMSQEKMNDEDYDIAYNSLFDEAYNMAFTLKQIDDELRAAAQCEGDYPGGYPPSQLLPNLCKIMYADHGYWRNKKYWNKGLSFEAATKKGVKGT